MNTNYVYSYSNMAAQPCVAYLQEANTTPAPKKNTGSVWWIKDKWRCKVYSPSHRWLATFNSSWRAEEYLKTQMMDNDVIAYYK